MAGRISSKMKAKRAGKANSDKASDKSEEEFDTSILSKPLETSINNIGKLLKLYQTATDEIRGYLVKECDILYECRVCRSIFRSISNFILHKRLFCEEKHNHQNNKWPRKEEDEYLDILLKETDTTADKNEQLVNSKKNLNSIIDGLTQKKQFGFEIDNFSIDEFYKQNQETFNSPLMNSKKLNLEQIQGTSAAVFQTLKLGEESIFFLLKKAMEIEQLTEGQTVILGPDGKVININQSKPISIEEDDLDLTCKKCNITFTTRKTFLSHMKYKHDNSRLVYPCLECSETFVSVWSVYRHLYNIHRKSLPEVRKMRSKIQAKAFKKKEDTIDDKPNTEEEQKNILNIHELNQEWMDNFETDNDIQMCGGCGRRFERKAALNSHSQTCQKRIAAKNIINSNKQKRLAAAAEEKTTEKKTAKVVRTETEADKKCYDSQNVAKKRKIGIQIRCDYSKPADKTPVQKKEPVPIIISDDKKNDKPDYLVTYVNKNISFLQEKVGLHEAEVVSIPSSDSSPSKDETDPLALKDSQTSSDSEIEGIIDPTICNNIFEEDAPSSENFEIKTNFEDDENKLKISTLNETTLKLIELINSDITIEKLQPTLDEKMSNYVNLKKLLCIPCDVKFSNISKLRLHMSTHFNWWRFRCDICAFKAYDKNDVIDHVKEMHNIQNCEKIEAIIFSIPEWETYELSSKDFIKINAETQNIVSASPEEEIPVACGADIDGCFVMEPESNLTTNNKNKGLKRNRGAKSIKTRNKSIDVKKEVSTDDRSDNSGVSDNDPGESSSSKNMDSSNPQDIRKMVYEVIFGDVTTKSDSITSSSCSSEDKDNLHLVSSNDKKGHTKFVSSHNQARRTVNTEEFSRDKVTLVDPKTFLTGNISESDDDIYIVENEELVAVK